MKTEPEVKTEPASTSKESAAVRVASARNGSNADKPRKKARRRRTIGGRTGTQCSFFFLLLWLGLLLGESSSRAFLGQAEARWASSFLHRRAV